MPRIALATILALLCSLAVATAAQAAPKRVVALEWDVLENLSVLGVRPVGAADIDGYRSFVGVGIPGGIQGVGTRQQPSLERIARLRPDLIVVPRFRSTSNLSTLRTIAPVLVYDSYPGDRSNGKQFSQMVANFRQLASQVGRRAQGERVLAQMSRSLRGNAAAIRRDGKRGTRMTFAQPSGTAGSPSVRLFTRNSIVSGVFDRIGLRNYWGGGNGLYGYNEVGIESLRKVQRGWLSFGVPRQFSGTIGRFTAQRSYTSLDMVRKGRVLRLPGDTWPFGGPRSTELLADRVTALLVRR